MRFEQVPVETVNKAFHRSKLQVSLEAFLDMEVPVVRCDIQPGEYVSVNSARNAYNKRAKALGYPIKLVTICGKLYMINLSLIEGM